MSENEATITQSPLMAKRFRGFYPVVIDVETGGFNEKTDALLEIAALTLKIDETGTMAINNKYTANVEPFAGSNIEPASLEITGIDPYHPFRMAKPEDTAIRELFKFVSKEMKQHGCTRAIMIGHNTTLDLNFINAAASRSKISRNPFHPFSTFDTVSLAGLAYGQTVLSKAAEAAGLEWSNEEAHSALYDATQTANLFCKIVNSWNSGVGSVWI